MTWPARVMVGDTVESTVNDSVGLVVAAVLNDDQSVTLTVRKTAGIEGHVAIGGTYPESPALCRVVEPWIYR